MFSCQSPLPRTSRFRPRAADKFQSSFCPSDVAGSHRRSAHKECGFPDRPFCIPPDDLPEPPASSSYPPGDRPRFHLSCAIARRRYLPSRGIRIGTGQSSRRCRQSFQSAQLRRAREGIAGLPARRFSVQVKGWNAGRGLPSVAGLHHAAVDLEQLLLQASR